MQYERTTLQNGLRLLVAPMPGMRSASISFFFTVGSRYESNTDAGISHFIEHMLFKGSEKYPNARLISEAIEGVGGVFNASTGKELTHYSARVPGEHASVVLDVLADMVHHSLFDPVEIEKERSVIIEELSSTHDDPQEWVGLLIDEAMWPKLPLGRDDAGYIETVSNMQRQQMLDYLDEFYRPNSLIISVAGNIDSDCIVEKCKRLFSTWDPRQHATWAKCLPPADTSPIVLIEKQTEQVNLCLGTLGIAYSSPDYYTLMLINAILGDGMSSRLFQTIREEQGLAYDIGSYFNSYAETGNFVVSAGVDPSQVEAAVRAIVNELSSLCTTPVPSDELDRIKAYIKGGLVLGLEGTSQVAYWLGSQESLRGKILDVDEITAHIEAVTARDIQRLAQTCFAPQWRHLALIGPCEPTQAEFLGTLLNGGD
ncbi:MAG TPA: pitrilysin family protein [Ktedonobacteraceae bacterium]|nr:pitrilysin family protein [Ktedonobacteraceae bacterium]